MAVDDEMDAGEDDGGGHTGRRAFMAGAAGLAAGATLLGAASPAGALGVTGEYPIPLQYMDMSLGTVAPVDLGTGGFATGIFSAFGDMAAVSIRILVGSGADTGNGPWVVDGGDLPSGFVPVASPNDVTPVGTAAWMGTGQIVDFTNLFQNAYQLGCAWVNFSGSGGPAATLVWSLPDQHNDGSGNVMFNAGGTVPFGAPLAEGAFLYSSMVYLVTMPEPE